MSAVLKMAALAVAVMLSMLSCTAFPMMNNNNAMGGYGMGPSSDVVRSSF
jgi:hypothetical protein